MIIKFQCPKCKQTNEIYFETNGRTSPQNEERQTECCHCHKKMTVALKELTARIETYIHQHL